MLYMPYRRTRQASFIYLAILSTIVAISVVVRFWLGVMHPMTPLEAGRVSMIRIDGWEVIIGSTILSLLFATIVGLNLAAENDGHLEIAWTLPISRAAFALRVFGADLLAMLLAIVVTSIVAIGLVDVYLGQQAVVFVGSSTSGTFSTEVDVGKKIPEHLLGSTQGVVIERKVERDGKRVRVTEVRSKPIDVPREALRALLFTTFPMCIYAWITALSASLKRNRGIVAGLFWPIALGIGGLQFVNVPLVRAVFTAINAINPLAIYSHTSEVIGSPPYTGLISIVVLLALAIVQWRRLES